MVTYKYILSLYTGIVNNKDKVIDKRSDYMKALTKNTDIEQKAGTLEQAGMRYGFGRNSMRKIAEDAGAIIKIGKSVRVNFTSMDKYLDALSGE